jgi:hypothetical protein
MSKLGSKFLLLSAVYGLAFLLFAWRLLKNIRAGGDTFQQGDWLINFGDGLVRRGASGEVFLALSKDTGQSVVVPLGIVQIIVLALVMLMLFLFAVRTDMSTRVTLLLLSPMLVLFWFNDKYAPFRPEVLGYLAFVPLFLSPRREISISPIVLSLGLFALGVAFFEANVAFAVPLALVFYILLGSPRGLVPMAAAGFVAALGTTYGLIFMSVPSAEAMCARATSAGASPVVCEGLMLWMAKDFATVLDDAHHEFMSFGGRERFLKAIATVAILIACLLFVLGRFLREPRVGIYLGISILAFVPFYPLGSDWGRWLSAQVFTCLFVIMALDRASPSASLRAPLTPLVSVPVLVLHLTVGFFHMVPFPIPGFVFNLVTAVHNALT